MSPARLRVLRWAVGLLVLAVLGALLTRVLLQRKPGMAPGDATPAAVPARPASGAAAISGAALELSPVDVAKATQAELTRSVAISGSLRAAQSAFVKARVAAEIRTLDVREGDRVTANQLIGRLDATEFDWRLRQALDQVANAEAQLDIAARTLENNKALVDQGFISRNALETSASSEAAARAAVQAARAAAELARKAVRDTEIRAPIAGLVSQRLAQPGERVALDTRIVEVVDLSRIELEVAVPADDAAALRIGQTAAVNVDGLADPLRARVARINPSTQSGTRAVLAYLELEAHPALRQGLFARGTVDIGRTRALVVPASAVRLDQTRPYVLALQDGRAVARPVTVGQQGQTRFQAEREAAVEITEGLTVGATVLRGSVGQLREGTLLRLAAPAAAATAASAPAASAATR